MQTSWPAPRAIAIWPNVCQPTGTHSSERNSGAVSSSGISLARMNSKATSACRAAVKTAVRSFFSTYSQLSRQAAYPSIVASTRRPQ